MLYIIKCTLKTLMIMYDKIIWRKENNIWLLYQGDDILIQVVPVKIHQYEVTFQGKKYSLFKTQAWKSNWRFIREDGRELLRLVYNLFNNRGKITFENGSNFLLTYEKFPHFSISFYDPNHRSPIINYHISESFLGNKEPKMSIEYKEIPTNKLLALLGLGMALLQFHKSTEIDFTTFILLTSQ